MEENEINAEDTDAKEMDDIIQDLVTSGESSLNPVKLKKLKSYCRKEEKLLNHTFLALFTNLRKDHAEIRYSAYQITCELFTRSHDFRVMLLENFQDYIDLTTGVNFDYPLPLPKNVSDNLKTESLCSIREWHKKYGPAYLKLRLGFDFLKHVKKVDFSNNARPLLQQEHQSHQNMLSRKDILNGVKLDKLKAEMENDLWETSNCIAEIENCLQLLIPSFKDYENSGIDFTGNNSNQVDSSLDSMRDIGLGVSRYNVELDLNKIIDLEIEQTENNFVIVDKLKDSIKSANRVIMPRLKSWLTSAGKYGANSSITKQLIDLKEQLQFVLDKYYELKLTGESDESDADNFVEVPEVTTIQKAAQNPKTIKNENNTKIIKSSLSKTKDTFVWKPLSNSNEEDFTSYEYAIKKQKLLIENKPPNIKKEFPKKKKKKGELQSKAPVITFGHDLLLWDKQKMKELSKNISMGSAKEYDVGHRFWSGLSASQGDDGVSQAVMSSLTSRSIEFSGTFEPVTRFCRAPLRNGKLCSRQDRFKCPFHGKIIDRDSCGNPVDKSLVVSTSALSTAEKPWLDEEFTADLEAGLGGKVKLGRKKKKKKNGLRDLKKLHNTSRNRLSQKVLNSGSLKRVSKTLDALDTKRSLDKFGDNFNYALH